MLSLPLFCWSFMKAFIAQNKIIYELHDSRIEQLEHASVCFIQMRWLLDPHQRNYSPGQFRHQLEFLDWLNIEGELQAFCCRKRRRRNLITKRKIVFLAQPNMCESKIVFTISRWRKRSCSLRTGFNPSTSATNFSSASKNWGFDAMRGAPVHGYLFKRTEKVPQITMAQPGSDEN